MCMSGESKKIGSVSKNKQKVTVDEEVVSTMTPSESGSLLQETTLNSKCITFLTVSRITLDFIFWRDQEKLKIYYVNVLVIVIAYSRYKKLAPLNVIFLFAILYGALLKFGHFQLKSK